MTGTTRCPYWRKSRKLIAFEPRCILEEGHAGPHIPETKGDKR